MQDDDNWLDAEVFPCPSCDTKLFRVNGSPFFDGWHLYCGQCPRSVEVSYYNEKVSELRKSVPDGASPEQAVEARRAPCQCGGSFKFSSLPRCLACGVVVADRPGVEISPFTGCEGEDRDPTPEEQAMFDAFEEEFVRRTDLWSQ